MAQRLSGGNDALALLCNTLPTGAILAVLILIFGPVSGAHFNPAVSLAFGFRGDIPWPTVGLYLLAQLRGAVVGVWAAHLMFELPVWQLSTHGAHRLRAMARGSRRDFRPVADDLRLRRQAPAAVAYAVGLYITAAYWFTASTSFANPAVTLARSLSDTFAGIAPAGVAAFVGAQMAGMLAAVLLGRWLWRG